MSRQQGQPSGLRMGAQPAPVDATKQAMEHLGGATGMVRTATQHQTAITVTKPRDLKEVEARIMNEAARMGTDFIYRWRQKTSDPRLDEGDGKVTIEGMSIDGAMVVARNWGNCSVPTTLEDETPTHFLIRAEFLDLETTFALPRLYRQRKSGGPGGKMEDDRKEDISFQIGQSKAQRNAIDKAMPFWLISQAIEAAKSAAAEKFKDVAQWAPRVIDHLLKVYGVEESRVVARMRKPPAEWTPYDILTLELIVKALRDKETMPDTEFPKPEAPADDGKTITVEGTAFDEGQPAQQAPQPEAQQVQQQQPADQPAQSGVVLQQGPPCFYCTKPVGPNEAVWIGPETTKFRHRDCQPPAPAETPPATPQAATPTPPAVAPQVPTSTAQPAANVAPQAPQTAPQAPPAAAPAKPFEPPAPPKKGATRQRQPGED